MEKTTSMDCWGHSWAKGGWDIIQYLLATWKYNTFDGQQQQWKSRGKFVNVPYCNMGDFAEQAWRNEFGCISSIDPVS